MATRKIEISNGLGFVKLTRGLYSIIYIDDIPLVENYNWYAGKQQDGRCYAVRDEVVNGKRKIILLHRFLNNTQEGFDTDHISGVTLDNRKTNLRTATRSQNNHNSKIPRNNKSGFKGVSWNNRAKKWRAYIHFNSKQIHLGLFNNPEDAYSSHCNASKKYYGQFGRVS